MWTRINTVTYNIHLTCKTAFFGNNDFQRRAGEEEAQLSDKHPKKQFVEKILQKYSLI